MARKKHTLGCLFYVALVLLVLVVFLFNRQTVQDVIEQTGFAKLFRRHSEAPPEVVVSPPQRPEPQEPRPEPQPEPVKPEPQRQTPQPETQPERPGSGERVVVTVRRPSPEQKAPAQRAAPEKTPEIRSRQARLFYVAVDSDGTMHLKGVTRPVEFTDAPLTATLEALLNGPSAAEARQGLLTMISPESRLLRAYVRGNIAYLDFNEAFRFNALGKEGLVAQLQQIVYCVTEFANVTQVQFLIEGSVSEYLGPEGLYIGKPLSRESFRN